MTQCQGERGFSGSYGTSGVHDTKLELVSGTHPPIPTVKPRSDTHFLLYIYDNLRSALLDRSSGEADVLHTCLEHSQETALRVYEREVYDAETGEGPGGWQSMMTKWGRFFTGTQLEVFRAAHRWRDGVARDEDESTRYILPNHYLFQIAERLPADLPALLGIFRPVPPSVRIKAGELLETIHAAVKRSAKGGSGLQFEDVDTREKQPQIVTSIDGQEPGPTNALTGKKDSGKQSRNESLWKVAIQRTYCFQLPRQVVTNKCIASITPRPSKLESRTGVVTSSLFPSTWFDVRGCF